MTTATNHVDYTRALLVCMYTIESCQLSEFCLCAVESWRLASISRLPGLHCLPGAAENIKLLINFQSKFSLKVLPISNTFVLNDTDVLACMALIGLTQIFTIEAQEPFTRTCFFQQY